VEAGIVTGDLKRGRYISAGGYGLDQVTGDELAARSGAGNWFGTVAKIGDGRPAAILRDAHPGSALLEITSAEDMGCIAPVVGGQRRSREKFVAIGSDDQGIARIRAMCNQNQAHQVSKHSSLRALSVSRTDAKSQDRTAASRLCSNPTESSTFS